MIVAGIDYSMTSPAICVHTGEDWSINNCIFYYLVKTDKHQVITDTLKGSIYPEWSSPEHRFENLAKWSLGVLSQHRVSSVNLENYAMGASGKVFHIGENTGLLKHSMWKNGIEFVVTPPTVIKKFATGKGNANKEKMWDSFIDETRLNLFNKLGQEQKKNWTPVSDIVDSYYLAKHGFVNLTAQGPSL